MSIRDIERVSATLRTRADAWVVSWIARHDGTYTTPDEMARALGVKREQIVLGYELLIRLGYKEGEQPSAKKVFDALMALHWCGDYEPGELINFKIKGDSDE